MTDIARGQAVQDQRIPTISRVAGDTLVELVYDATTRETALAVSRFGGLWNLEQEVRISTSEVLIPYGPRNNLLAHECVLFASRPEHHGDKAELLAAIDAFLARYVALTPVYRRIAAHYVLLTWVHDAFQELNYLRLQGDYGTGKTRGLLAIGLLCYKPFFASGASTVSPIFHVLDRFGATLILDEADFRLSDATSALVKILNNGTMQGLPVLRTMQNREKEFNPRAFRVFGPKIVAMRGSYRDEGLESRFLTENMNACAPDPSIPIHVPPEMRAEALALRNKLLHFRFCTYFETKLDPSLLVPDLEFRLNQIALPLLSIVDAPQVRSEIVTRLRDGSKQTSFRRRRELGRALVGVLRDALANGSGSNVPVRVIATGMNAASAAFAHLTTREIARLIRDELKIPVHKSGGIHVVPRSALSALADVTEQYPQDAQNASK